MDDRYRDGRQRARRGEGSMRERRPGVWEVRVVVGNDPVTGGEQAAVVHRLRRRGSRSRPSPRARRAVRSRPIRALLQQRGGLARGRAARAVPGSGARVGASDAVVATPRWRAGWPVSRSAAADVAVLTPQLVDARIGVWRRAGASVALVWARRAVLHSCLSWATRQRLLRSNPIATMKTPPRPLPPQTPPHGGDRHTPSGR
jgi:hypothetical protein